jgi:hypothetical protein
MSRLPKLQYGSLVAQQGIKKMLVKTASAIVVKESVKPIEDMTIREAVEYSKMKKFAGPKLTEDFANLLSELIQAGLGEEEIWSKLEDSEWAQLHPDTMIQLKNMKGRGLTLSNLENLQKLEEFEPDINNEEDVKAEMASALGLTVDEVTFDGVEDNFYIVTAGDKTYAVTADEQDCIDKAYEKNLISFEDSPQTYVSKENIGYFINDEEAEKTFRNVYNEQNEGYVNDIETENDSTYPNRLRSELVERDIITDEEGMNEEFDIEDAKETMVEQMTDESISEGNGGYDYFASNFGDEEAVKFATENGLVDLKKASEEDVDNSGWAYFISSDEKYNETPFGWIYFEQGF